MHSLRHLEVVRSLAQHRHFGRAAAALGVSQPALTRTLKHIEDTLGVTLFDREGVSPTPFGQIVLDHSGPVLLRFAELMREISLLKGLEAGEIAVSAGPYAADISGQRAIGLFSQQHPKVSVRLSILNWTQAAVEVLEGRVDLAIADISEFATNADFDTELLRTSKFTFFCASHHPLATKPDLVFEDLLHFPWVGPTVPSRMHEFLPKVDLPFGALVVDGAPRFQPRIVVETFSAAKAIVLAGQGLSVTLPLQVQREIDEGACKLLPVELPWMRLNYGFISKRGRTHSPAALRFMAIVRRLERELPA